MSLVHGTRLGPYEIEAPIGAGGMGEVYKARDTRLDRSVAIKVLPNRRATPGWIVLANHGGQTSRRYGRALPCISG